MALIKCRDCGNQVSTEAAACPHCGAPQKAAAPPIQSTVIVRHEQAPPPKKKLGCFSVCVLVIFGIAIISAIIGNLTRVESGVSSNTPAQHSQSTPQKPKHTLSSFHSPDGDDAKAFITKYGKPEKEDSTAYDDPRPPMVTKILTYDPEHVNILFIADAPIASPPPYMKWKLIGFTDSATTNALQLSEMEARLESRLKQ